MNAQFLGPIMAILATTALAADYPAPREADWTAPNFRFHTGETMPVRLHYTTIGAPTGQPVLVLHGTAGNAATMLNPGFAGALFGPGQALDASRYFIILPDALGTGKSTRPSDGLRAKFPAYNYDDMVQAQYRLVTEGLGIKHLRLVIGNSMGGMQTWNWGVTYPDMMDALVPMASQPTAMASRNWIMRRTLTQAIRSDPAWLGGDYTSQPQGFRVAMVMFNFATSGGALAWQAQAPTGAAADALVADRMAAPMPADANDYLFQWESSRDYDPALQLGRIKAAVLAINSADDERNPPESGLTAAAIAKIPGARLHLIPASADTRGHGTTGMAKFWQAELAQFLASAPKR
jgi:homoserine O-acetyltransferase